MLPVIFIVVVMTVIGIQGSNLNIMVRVQNRMGRYRDLRTDQRE